MGCLFGMGGEEMSESIELYEQKAEILDNLARLYGCSWEEVYSKAVLAKECVEKIYSMTPTAYRYTASCYTKWHYQEKFPSANKRGQIKNLGRIEVLFVLPDHPSTPY